MAKIISIQSFRAGTGKFNFYLDNQWTGWGPLLAGLLK
jgi:hypothetical protein